MKLKHQDSIHCIQLCDLFLLNTQYIASLSNLGNTFPSSLLLPFTHSPPPSVLPPQHQVTSLFPTNGCSANSLLEPRCLLCGPNSGRCQPLSISPCGPSSECVATNNRAVLSASIRLSCNVSSRLMGEKD